MRVPDWLKIPSDSAFARARRRACRLICVSLSIDEAKSRCGPVTRTDQSRRKLPHAAACRCIGRYTDRSEMLRSPCCVKLADIAQLGRKCFREHIPRRSLGLRSDTSFKDCPFGSALWTHQFSRCWCCWLTCLSLQDWWRSVSCGFRWDGAGGSCMRSHGCTAVSDSIGGRIGGATIPRPDQRSWSPITAVRSTRLCSGSITTSESAIPDRLAESRF